jgi:hypothetical protein
MIQDNIQVEIASIDDATGIAIAMAETNIPYIISRTDRMLIRV